MIVSHLNNVEGVKVESKDAKDVLMKVLISVKEGWEDYVMRVFEVEKGGYTPKHSHPWQHIIFIISGKGILYLKGENHKVETNAFAYIPPNVEHQFSNNEDEKLRFICIVPKEGHK